MYIQLGSGGVKPRQAFLDKFWDTRLLDLKRAAESARPAKRGRRK
jgi:hypothetical protein